RRNSELELWLERFAEPLAALARRAGGRDRRPVLDLAWRALVGCQFHDAVAGCVSDAVAQSLAARYVEVEALAREIVRGSVHDLVRHDPDVARERPDATKPSLVVWNAAARPRGGVMIADVTRFRRDVPVGPPSGRRVHEATAHRPFALVGAGRTIPVQVLGRALGLERLEAARHYPDQDEVERVRVAFRMPAVPGLGLATLSLGDPQPLPSGDGVGVRGRTLANRWVEVALEGTGALAVHDRRAGERYGGLLRLEDEGDAGDTYTFCPVARDRLLRAAGPVTVRRLAAGPLVAALEARLEMAAGSGVGGGGRRGRVALRLVGSLHADSPLVRCVLE